MLRHLWGRYIFAMPVFCFASTQDAQDLQFRFLAATWLSVFPAALPQASA
jgi:hypothetical protein